MHLFVLGSPTLTIFQKWILKIKKISILGNFKIYVRIEFQNLI